MNKQRDPDLNDRHVVEPFFHAGPYTASDLPIDEDGRIYHLQIKPGQIAPDILIVGDPGRVEVSCSGFFAPQGRDIGRAKPSVPELDRILSEYDPRVGGQRVENMEMEVSFLIHFLGGLGHWAEAICPIIADRRKDTSHHHYQEAIRNATMVALSPLANVRSRYFDVRMS